MGKLSMIEPENMGGNILASHATKTKDTGIATASCVNDNKVEWIIDTEVTNCMTYNKEMLNEEQVIINNKRVHSPNEKVLVRLTLTVVKSNEHTIKNVLYIPNFGYCMLSISRIAREFSWSVNFFPNLCISQDLSNGKVLEIVREKD